MQPDKFWERIAAERFALVAWRGVDTAPYQKPPRLRLTSPRQLHALLGGVDYLKRSTLRLISPSTPFVDVSHISARSRPTAVLPASERGG